MASSLGQRVFQHEIGKQARARVVHRSQDYKSSFIGAPRPVNTISQSQSLPLHQRDKPINQGRDHPTQSLENMNSGATSGKSSNEDNGGGSSGVGRATVSPKDYTPEEQRFYADLERRRSQAVSTSARGVRTSAPAGGGTIPAYEAAGASGSRPTDAAAAMEGSLTKETQVNEVIERADLTFVLPCPLYSWS